MNYRTHLLLVAPPLLVLTLLWIPSGPVAAREDEPAAAGGSGAAGTNADKVSTHTVTREIFEIEVGLAGVVEAAHLAAVSIEPEEWNELRVLEAVEHGARVNKDEPLIKLDPKDLDEAILDLERSIKLSEIALEETRLDVRHLKKTLPLDLQAAELARRQAREDLEHFLSEGRRASEKNAAHAVKRAENYLAYEKEELDQLEKMYRADDLTEESEEIVLRRQRDAVQNAIHSLERAKLSRDETLAFSLPRQETRLRNDAERRALAWEKAKLTLPMGLEKQQLELASREHKLEKSAARLAELRRDRELMTIRSPADGIVYYGQFVHGRWSGSGAMASKLRQGGSLSSREVLMTIVEPRPFVLRASVPETDLGRLHPGLRGKAVPAAYPETELPARITDLAAVPVNPGVFEAVIEVEESEGSRQLMPGMTCTIGFTAYRNPAALTVPTKAVFADEDVRGGAMGERFVYVAREGGGHERRAVKRGRTAAEKTEILEGLAAGEEVLLERPKAE